MRDWLQGAAAATRLAADIAQPWTQLGWRTNHYPHEVILWPLPLRWLTSQIQMQLPLEKHKTLRTSYGMSDALLGVAALQLGNILRSSLRQTVHIYMACANASNFWAAGWAPSSIGAVHPLKMDRL